MSASLAIHPAYPSAAMLTAEAERRRAIDADMATAAKLRAILMRAQAEVEALPLWECGCPVLGYDVADIVTLLRDMLPMQGDELRTFLEENA